MLKLIRKWRTGYLLCAAINILVGGLNSFMANIYVGGISIILGVVLAMIGSTEEDEK